MDRSGMDFPLMLFLDATSNPLFKVKPGAEKAITVKNFPTRVIDGSPTYVVSVPVPADKGGKPGSALLYIGAKDMLIHRCRFNVKSAGGKPAESVNVEFVCFYTDVKPNAPTSADSFTYSPPADAKKVDHVDPPFDRAFNKAGP